MLSIKFELRPVVPIILIWMSVSPVVLAASKQKERVDPQAVERIEIVKRGHVPIKHLEPTETTEFINAWNEAQPIGLCKYIFEYRFILHLKDGRTTEYRTNGENIKEENDYCYSAKERGLYERLWLISKERK